MQSRKNLILGLIIPALIGLNALAQDLDALDRACDAKDFEACHKMASALARSGNEALTTDYLRMGCSYGDTSACTELDDVHKFISRGGKFAKASPRKPPKTIAQRCFEEGGEACSHILKDCNEKNRAAACADLASIRANQKDPEAAEYVKKACRLGHKGSCDILAQAKADTDLEREKTIAEVQANMKEMQHLDQLQQKVQAMQAAEAASERRNQNIVNAANNLANYEHAKSATNPPSKTNCVSRQRKDFYGNTEWNTDCSGN
jgi:TPR repeat protein